MAKHTLRDQWQNQFGRGRETLRSVQHIGKDLAGRPIYRFTIVTPFGSRTATYVQSETGLLPPLLTIPNNQQPQIDASREASDLQRAKSRWLNWVIGLHPSEISDFERRNFQNRINSWSGTAQQLQDSMQIASQNRPFGATVDVQRGDAEPTLTIGGLGGFGGGGGGGSFGPEYVKPDQRVVEDFVVGTMVQLAGTVLDDELDRIVAVYMTDHRRNFDTLDQTIDPTQSVVEAVRSTTEYKTIHQNRPDSADERTWISDRRKAAAEGGLTISKQEDFAITQATVAGDLPDVEVAGSVAQLQTSGKAEGVLERRIRNAAQGLFGVVRR